MAPHRPMTISMLESLRLTFVLAGPSSRAIFTWGT